MDPNEEKKERKYPTLDLTQQNYLDTNDRPLLVVQSPKTPTLSRKLKAVSLDSDLKDNQCELNRDVFSMPNTPKKQHKLKIAPECIEDIEPKTTLTPCFASNLKKFASNSSISGSQTLKTLPEVMTLHDFSDNVIKIEKKIKAKGLLERRGSNASLTIDLGSNSSISETKPTFLRLNTAKSVSNLNLTTFGSSAEKCVCLKKPEVVERLPTERKKSQEACGNCIIYESVPNKGSSCKVKCSSPSNQLIQRHICCISKCRRKSLSNENLYVPPCSFCNNGNSKECVNSSKHCKGNRRARYPRQPDLDGQLLSEDFKSHLQNMQYLQTAGKVLSIDELKDVCEDSRVPKLHQEFWEVPLNLQEKCYVSGSQSKNRYRGVLPNEHSRVHLPTFQTYIHANFIKGADYTETAYIATQGPMAHTCHDFWNMIWDTNCRVVVMLTGLVEKGKNKCELYFPLGKESATDPDNKFFVKTCRIRDRFTFDSKHMVHQELEEELVEFQALDEISFDNYTIKFLSMENTIPECPLRYFEVIKTSEKKVESRIVRHYWYMNWQDHKMAEPKKVLQVAVRVLEIIDKNSNQWEPKDNISKDDVKTKDDKIVRTNGMENWKKNSAKGSIIEHNKAVNNGIYLKSEVIIECMDKNTGGIKAKEILKESGRWNKSMLKGLEMFRDWHSFGDGPETTNDEYRRRENGTWRSCSEGRKLTLTKPVEPQDNLNPFREDFETNDTRSLNNEENPFDIKIKTKNSNKETKIGEISKKSSAARRKSAESIRIPLVVHCSAGIGRTGCFLAILNGMQQLKANKNVDVLAILCSLRLNRGGMVQTAEQYELIHRVLNLYAETML